MQDRLPAWMLMVREYRHLKMLKRGGRAFDPDGVNTTLPGSLAIPCRACPMPDVNLPRGWRNVERGKEWLYMLLLAMDANFHLRSKLRGISVDPHLSPGWSYFVNHIPYASFIANYVDQAEAVLNMLTKKSKGLRATGMAAVSCACHQLFRPLGMGDLQKGERQCNMDYVFASSVVGLGLRMLTISYDVACQWFVHFPVRMPLLPQHLHISSTVNIRPLVPKFHLQSHEEKCHSPFSFNFMKGGARTDGEGVERNWDDLNGQAASTSEMLPGHRWETLDDCCAWTNWRKTMGLGNLLLKRLILAIPQAIHSYNDFTRFTSRLREETPQELEAMEEELAEWEADRTKSDPYLMPKSTVTLDQVRLQMAEEEKARVEAGTSFTHEITAGAFLLLGMEIRNLQDILRRDVKGQRRSTLLQTTTIVERRTTLLKRVAQFREIQAIYMPGFDPANHGSDEPSPEHVKDFTLYMPSELSKPHIRKFCPNGLAGLEDRLRYAEASDSLERLRHHLRTRSFANKFKIANITGQIKNTHARETQGRIDDKVSAASTTYRRARAAVKKLRGGGPWALKLQILEKSDVRALNERELTQNEKDEIKRVHIANGVLTSVDVEDECRAAKLTVGEGARGPSWIWFSGVQCEGLDDPMTRKALRVEWAKAKARGERWGEEVMLLDEEMRRVLQFCDWKEQWWLQQKHGRSLTEPHEKTLREGLDAYAEKQMALERAIAQSWEAKWKSIRARAQPIITGNVPADVEDEDEDEFVGEPEVMEFYYEDYDDAE
ncbi:hypothetical protein HWV62_22000 [Athelia sp. TMB]|nr:hypothetical protein HWV62_22000 [Athelia sp. TMB]